MRKILFISALIGILFTFPSLSMAQMKGDATYYSNRLHGHRVSDGSRYHKDSLTCAHRTLPFGTLLKVRNPRNGAEVVVKVTDRGPYRRGAIVDLSYAAAKRIGLVNIGVAKVEVERLDDNVSVPYRKSAVDMPELRLPDPQTGIAYSVSEWNKKCQAEQMEKTMQNSLAQRKVSLKRNGSPRWRVLHGQLTASSNTQPTQKNSVKK